MSNNGLPDLPDEGDVKKRQTIVVSIVTLVAVLILAYAYLTNPSTQLNHDKQLSRSVVDVSTPGQSADPIQNWVLKNESRLRAYEESLAKEKTETDQKINQMMEQIKQLNQDKSELYSKLKASKEPSGFPAIPLPPRDSLPVVKAPQILPGQPADTNVTTSGISNSKSLMNQVMQSPEASSKIIKIKFATKGKKKPHIRDTIPAGSFGKAVLLSGLDAPTGGLAERNPHPVLLELIDNGNLPNRYKHKVKQCRVIASGTGNISDERAYLRLERLTCVLNNGDIISEVATGTVTGEDGKNGLRGTFVTKQGQLIANAFLAGALSGIGDAITSSYSTISTSATGSVTSFDTDKIAEAGLASGMGNTMEKIADWYFKRAEETYPIIEVSAGRIVDLFLTEDLPLGSNLLANHTRENMNE